MVDYSKSPRHDLPEREEGEEESDGVDEGIIDGREKPEYEMYI